MSDAFADAQRASGIDFEAQDPRLKIIDDEYGRESLNLTIYWRGPHARDADPDRAYVAVQGAAHGQTEERGIYRTVDGGATWEKVLYVSPSAGASELAMDPTNPRILYAAFWDHIRLPWQVVSGGEGSGLWKSTDGGDSWRPIDEGLPELMGKTAIDVSPANPERVFAMIMIEADPGGGLYRSEDGGESWELATDLWTLRARPWYYTEIYADPNDENTVYVLNAPMMKSVDAGRTFTSVGTPHTDNHDLWINPHDSEVMINANDGGANVSFNGGDTWSRQQNQPTVQFYRVNTDDRFPYPLRTAGLSLENCRPIP